MTGQRHPYAGHPAALVLADHIAAWRAQPTARVVCDCDWIGPSCDHIPHVVEVLHRAGLLAGPPASTIEEVAEGDPGMEATLAWFRDGGC